MVTTVEKLIPDAVIENFQRDGAVCLRGAFRDWVEPLSQGVEFNMANPGPTGNMPTIS